MHMVGRGRDGYCVIVPKALEAVAQKLRTAREPVVQVTVRRLLVGREVVVKHIVEHVRQGQSAQDPNVPAEATERYQACRVAHRTGGLGGTRHGDRALAKLDAQCCLLWKSKVRALENIVYKSGVL